MAIRNLDAITRHGEMITKQIANERKLKENSFWERVNIIKKTRNDAIDFVDTVNELCKNGLRGRFEEWLKTQNVSYTIYDRKIKVCCLNDRKQEAHVSYSPTEDAVCFGWNGYGMCESYSTTQNIIYFIHTYLDNKKYNDGLSKLAARLQPFLDSFFLWVESL